MLLLCTLRYVSMATVNKKSQQSSSSNGYALINTNAMEYDEMWWSCPIHSWWS